MCGVGKRFENTSLAPKGRAGSGYRKTVSSNESLGRGPNDKTILCLDPGDTAAWLGFFKLAEWGRSGDPTGANFGDANISRVLRHQGFGTSFTCIDIFLR